MHRKFENIKNPNDFIYLLYAVDKTTSVVATLVANIFMVNFRNETERGLCLWTKLELWLL